MVDSTNSWILEWGITHHVCNFLECFEKLRNLIVKNSHYYWVMKKKTISASSRLYFTF